MTCRVAAGVQGCRGKRVQGYKGTRVQGFRGSKREKEGSGVQRVKRKDRKKEPQAERQCCGAEVGFRLYLRIIFFRLLRNVVGEGNT